MIDQEQLTADLRKLLEKDLLPAMKKRAAAEADLDEALQAEHKAAKDAGRTGQVFEVWRDDHLTQVGVAWVLGCVFVRFMEDNGLVDSKDNFPRLAGPGAALRQAQDQYSAYIASHKASTDRDYLLWIFTDVGDLRGCHELFSKKHNPLWAHDGRLMDADAATRLIAFFQQRKTQSEQAELVHDFTDPTLGTRFIGDLYQNLSEAARKKYALLQTPIFVEEFILDRTLEPAIKEFGLCDQTGRELSAENKPIPSDHLIRLIDPTVGSGHFLLGAFDRLFKHWQNQEPNTNPAVLAERCLNSLFGVDLNPYAANIARFRLLVATLRATSERSLRSARDYHVNIAVGDSLLHGSFVGSVTTGELFETQMRSDSGSQYVTNAEDLATLRRFLMPHRYHVVVGNPPYITVKDAALSEAYRRRYGACHRKYALTVPFFERFVDLAVVPNPSGHSVAGFVGKITSNSFMKREFGKKLIETYLPRWDLTHVIDTQLAHIPQHGTSTAILFVRHRSPVSANVRLVSGLRREDSEPDPPENGVVWQAILAQVDVPGSESAFVSVSDTPRESFHHHPWSIGGGGAAGLKDSLDESGVVSLQSFIDDVGRTTHTGEDDAFYIPPNAARTAGFYNETVPLVTGEDVRDFMISSPMVSIFPYEKGRAKPAPVSTALMHHFWLIRSILRARLDFGHTPEQRGLRWFDHSMFFPARFANPRSVSFPFVATHNHFVMDRGGKVFNRHAPAIKLRPDASDSDHLFLCGVLNSSVAQFWMRQVLFCKGGGGIGGGIAAETWERMHEYDGTKIKPLPMPWEVNSTDNPLRTSVTALARNIDTLAQTRGQLLPASLLIKRHDAAITRTELDVAKSKAADLLRKMVATQEELDWLVYRAYGLIEITYAECAEPPAINLGERAFEIGIARKMEAGTLQTEWFRRHGSTPITQIPAHWPEAYKKAVENRIALIEAGEKQNKDIALIEQPEYKRRWNTEKWEEAEERALREWLLDRLEWGSKMPSAETTDGSRSAVWDERDPRLMTAARLADKMRGDEEFRAVAELYSQSHAAPDDLTLLVQQLVDAESVPFLPVLRYKETGLRNRAIWERTWELQREEDRLEALREKARGKMKAAEEALLAKLPSNEADETRTSSGALARLVENDATWCVAKAELDAVPANPEIEVPPRYTGKDFQNANYWRLRGKLDVPKERFVSLPHCGPDGDRTTLIAWAGFDHRQYARALTTYYTDRRANSGWEKTRFIPLLAGLRELLPWLKQWHKEPDADGHIWAEVVDAFIDDEARELGVTIDEIRAWEPPEKPKGKPGKKKKAEAEAVAE